MSEACCQPAEDRPQPECSQCGSRGTLVESQTIKALLTTSALARYQIQSLHFCPAPTCDTVYFGKGEWFGVADIRVPVWQKEPAGNRMVCYCFGENEGDIGREIALTGTSAAGARVKAHIAAKRCACEIRNPRGTCCLGDVNAAVSRARAVAAGAVSG
jgi:hypothetical protein